MSVKVEVQHLVGRRVRDRNGRAVGRIHEIAAERIGPRCIVHEYHLGTAGLLGRLGIYAGRLVGVGLRKPLRVPWRYLDPADPEHPILRCTKEELDAMQATLPPLEE